MKVICIYHRLGGFSSHHFNEAYGFMQEFARRGKELILLVSGKAEPRIVAQLKARAVLDDDPTFRLEWTLEERSQRFLGMLHRQVDHILEAGDWVLSTVSTQFEALALTGSERT